MCTCASKVRSGVRRVESVLVTDLVMIVLPGGVFGGVRGLLGLGVRSGSMICSCVEEDGSVAGDGLVGVCGTCSRLTSAFSGVERGSGIVSAESVTGVISVVRGSRYEGYDVEEQY